MTTKTTISWQPIMEHFGAEVDIDLNRDLHPAEVEELRVLFDERHLLLFRNQSIDYETQRKAAAMFGNVLPHEGDAKYISTVHDIDGNPIETPRNHVSAVEMFHSDMIYLPTLPVHAICLFAEDVRASRSGTRFVSALDPLPQGARAELQGRNARYMLDVEDYQRLKSLPFEEVAKEIDAWSEHPILLPSPRSGESVLLYTIGQTHSIVGLSLQENRAWFRQFEALLYDESRIYTHHWQQNDLLIWDNFALQHAKEPEQHGGPPPPRVLRRAILGPAPYSYLRTKS